MEELFDRLKGHVVTKMWDIARELDNEGKFTDPQELDDLKDCLSCLCKMGQLLPNHKL